MILLNRPDIRARLGAPVANATERLVRAFYRDLALQSARVSHNADESPSLAPTALVDGRLFFRLMRRLLKRVVGTRCVLTSLPTNTYDCGGDLSEAVDTFWIDAMNFYSTISNVVKPASALLQFSQLTGSSTLLDDDNDDSAFMATSDVMCSAHFLAGILLSLGNTCADCESPDKNVAADADGRHDHGSEFCFGICFHCFLKAEARQASLAKRVGKPSAVQVEWRLWKPVLSSITRWVPPVEQQRRHMSPEWQQRRRDLADSPTGTVESQYVQLMECEISCIIGMIWNYKA